jgi:hypothetical protein
MKSQTWTNRARRRALALAFAMAAVSLPPGTDAAAAARDTVQGTFTVKGKTSLFKHVYVTRSSNPAEPGSNYLSVLVSDAPVPETARTPAQLLELAKSGKIHAVRVVWKEGFDTLTSTPFHSEVDESGQPTAGGVMIDLRAYDERRLDAKINSRPLGQDWHFNATLEAPVVSVPAVPGDFAEPVPVVPPTGVERDTRVEAERGDPVALKRALGRLGYEYTGEAFLHAVNDGHADAVALFLRLGMSPDTASEGQPVLMSAATLCNPDPTGSRVAIVKALLAAHAKVDPKDENGSTPLLWSVNAGCPVEIARALIAAGANVNAKAKGGATPLMLAQALQRTELVQLLKQAGAKE